MLARKVYRVSAALTIGGIVLAGAACGETNAGSEGASNVEKVLLTAADLPTGFTVTTEKAGATSSLSPSSSAETTFTPAECKGKSAAPEGSAQVLATSKDESIVITEVASPTPYDVDEYQARMKRCAQYTITVSISGIASTSTKITRTPVDAPRTAADTVTIYEERASSTDPATDAPTTTWVARANVGKVSILLTSTAPNRADFDTLLTKAVDRARA